MPVYTKTRLSREHSHHITHLVVVFSPFLATFDLPHDRHSRLHHLRAQEASRRHRLLGNLLNVSLLLGIIPLLLRVVELQLLLPHRHLRWAATADLHVGVLSRQAAPLILVIQIPVLLLGVGVDGAALLYVVFVVNWAAGAAASWAGAVVAGLALRLLLELLLAVLLLLLLSHLIVVMVLLGCFGEGLDAVDGGARVDCGLDEAHC